MIIKDTSTVVAALKALFDNKEAYHLDMFQSGRMTSVADPGRPSVANTLGTILLNLAAEGEYVTPGLLDDAVIETGDRTLTRNRLTALRTLLEHDFIMRRVKGGGATAVLFPSEDLVQRMFTRMGKRQEQEKDWGHARSPAKETRKKRSGVKRRQLTKQQKMLTAIAADLGYRLAS